LVGRWRALLILFLALALAKPVSGQAQAPAVGAPVLIGLDAEFGNPTSTSAQAIRSGIDQAITEINGSGGVLGGRPLRLESRDNRSVPARALRNIAELAALPDMVAVFCGKFSPVAQEAIPLVHALGLIYLDPWAAADAILDHGYVPSYVFRLSLRDSWAMAALLDAARARGLDTVGLLVPNTSWGRSSLKAAEADVATHGGPTVTATEWYDWGEAEMAAHYAALHVTAAKAVVMVANEREGSLLVRAIGRLPAAERLPVFSHWGITGGNFPALAGTALAEVDLSVVQTFTFVDNPRPEAQRLGAALAGVLGVDGPGRIPSPVGVAHAYDLTRILALAIDLAGTTERARVRDALEQVRGYQGVTRDFDQPFTAGRHEALTPAAVFLARYRADGTLVPITPP